MVKGTCCFHWGPGLSSKNSNDDLESLIIEVPEKCNILFLIFLDTKYACKYTKPHAHKIKKKYKNMILNRNYLF